jgi:BirA family biotin operon repressor/biotin-[acetyl-CoA-carboxylase] ligase
MAPAGFDAERLRGLLPPGTDGVARPVVFLETVDSTSSEVARRLRSGADAGIVVVAAAQTAGRGRIGHAWSSPPGGNLYLSTAVTVPPPEGEHLTRVPLIAGVAAAEALLAAGLAAVRLKWPNDLMARGRKLGGLLCETADPRARPLRIVVGLGVNLSDAPLPDALHDIAITAPELAGGDLRPEPVAAAFVAGLERRLAGLERGGGATLAADWKALAEPFGRRVRVGGIEGESRDLDAAGRLLVRRDDGQVVAIACGVVEHLRESRGCCDRGSVVGSAAPDS